MTELPSLPLTREQAEAAIERLTGALVAVEAVQKALIQHILITDPASAGQLRLLLENHAREALERVLSESAECRQQFARVFAEATQLIEPKESH